MKNGLRRRWELFVSSVPGDLCEASIFHCRNKTLLQLIFVTAFRLQITAEIRFAIGFVILSVCNLIYITPITRIMSFWCGLYCCSSTRFESIVQTLQTNLSNNSPWTSNIIFWMLDDSVFFIFTSSSPRPGSQTETGAPMFQKHIEPVTTVAVRSLVWGVSQQGEPGFIFPKKFGTGTRKQERHPRGRRNYSQSFVDWWIIS